MNGSDYILCTDESGDTKICPVGYVTERNQADLEFLLHCTQSENMIYLK